jgi:hypothetical protein
MQSASTTSSPADTPWMAEPSGDGFFQVVNSESIIIAQRCVKEEADLFAAAPDLLHACKIYFASHSDSQLLEEAIAKAEGY